MRVKEILTFKEKGGAWYDEECVDTYGSDDYMAARAYHGKGQILDRLGKRDVQFKVICFLKETEYRVKFYFFKPFKGEHAQEESQNLAVVVFPEGDFKINIASKQGPLDFQYKLDTDGAISIKGIEKNILERYPMDFIGEIQNRCKRTGEFQILNFSFSST